MVEISPRNIALIGVFAALHVVLYVMSFGLWRNWSIYLMPLEGIILGPRAGLIAALIGSTIARTVRPTDFWIFGIIAEPLGVVSCGLLVKRQWKPLIIMYVIMLASYFMHPFGRWLPLWTILDILIGLILIYPLAKLFRNISEDDAKHLSLFVPLLAFIGTVTDSLTRVFLLIPAGFYILFYMTPEVVYLTFVGGAIDSYIEDILVVIVSSVVTVPILATLRKIVHYEYPIS